MLRAARVFSSPFKRFGLRNADCTRSPNDCGASSAGREVSPRRGCRSSSLMSRDGREVKVEGRAIERRVPLAVRRLSLRTPLSHLFAPHEHA